MRCQKCGSVIKDNTEICPICKYRNPVETSMNFSKIDKLTTKKEEILPDGYPRHYYHEDGKRGLLAIIQFYKKSFVTSDVCDLAEYWTQYLFNVINILILYITGEIVVSSEGNPNSFAQVIFFITVAILILSIIPSFTAMVRRLHDAGFSGFWVLLSLFAGVGSTAIFVLTLFPYKRNEHNRPYEKKPTIKVKFEE